MGGVDGETGARRRGSVLKKAREIYILIFTYFSYTLLYENISLFLTYFLKDVYVTFSL